MNAYEIEQIESRLRAETRLPLTFDAWVDIERRAREERAQMIGSLFARLFSAISSKFAGLRRHVQNTAANCTDARLRQS
ncbi:MAG: RSP_7527 family protein [Burkholderiales bacterium]